MALKRKSEFDIEPCIDSEEICIWEWPILMCEIEDKKTGDIIQITEKKDCEAVVDSLLRLMKILEEVDAN